MIVKANYFWSLAVMAMLASTASTTGFAETPVPGPPVLPGESSLPLAPVAMDADLEFETIEEALGADIEDSHVIPVGRRSVDGASRGSRRDRGLAEARTIPVITEGGEFAAPGATSEMIYKDGQWQVAETAITPPAAPPTGVSVDGEAEGAVRITDRSPERVAEGVPQPRASRHVCPECRHCPHGVPYHECKECEPPARMVRRYRLTHGMVFSPDYGWAPPGRTPISHVSVDYSRYWPGCWTDKGYSTAHMPARPSVYYPTDTTQLGYTYQHTPRWLPYHGMVPPVPHPKQWHQPSCNLYCPPCGMHAGACPTCEPGNVDGEELPSPPDVTEPANPTVTDVPGPPNGVVNESAQGPELNRSAQAPPLVPVPF